MKQIAGVLVMALTLSLVGCAGTGSSKYSKCLGNAHDTAYKQVNDPLWYTKPEKVKQFHEIAGPLNKACELKYVSKTKTSVTGKTTDGGDSKLTTVTQG